jgi:hypothetical protein
MDPAVDLAAAQAPPGAAYKGDDAERRTQALRLPPCGKDGMTRAKPTCRMKSDLLQRLLLDAEKSDIRARVATDDVCRDLASIGTCDRHVFVSLQRFLRRHDEARAPEKAARRSAPATVDRHEPRRNAIEQIGGKI